MAFPDELNSEQKPGQVEHFSILDLFKGINSHIWLGFKHDIFKGFESWAVPV